MADQRALDAISRIERALVRVEAAAARRPAGDASEDIQRVRTAHQLLRSRVEGAIGEIDRVLEAEARG